jgi:Family of unknown function (DUF6585)
MTSQALRAPAEPLPPAVAAAATQYQLGPLQRVFVPKKINWALLIFMILIGLATAFIGVGLIILFLAIRTPNIWPSRGAKRLYVFQLGFIQADSPDQPQVFRWDAIDTVFQKIVRRSSYGVTVSTEYRYTITRRDGYTIKITNFWNGVEELGRHINHNVSTALLPPMRAALAQGQSVQFGDIVISAREVSGKRNTVPWTQVKSVTVNAGYVRVNLAGKFFSLSTKPAAAIPNLPLFLTLADQLRQSATR